MYLCPMDVDPIQLFNPPATPATFLGLIAGNHVDFVSGSDQSAREFV